MSHTHGEAAPLVRRESGVHGVGAPAPSPRCSW